jgi:AsmA protein
VRKAGIALAIAVLLVAGAVVLAAMNLGSWINRNRDALAAEARERIGRDLSFGEVGISFAAGLAVRVADLRVGGDPAFSQEDLLGADAIEIHVKLFPLLFGNVEVGRIVVRRPSIYVIQSEKGLSTDSLGGGSGADEEAAPGGAPPALLVSLVDIRDGTIRWEDRTAVPPVDLRIEQLGFSASDLSFTEPVAFDLEASVFGSPGPNAKVSGTIGPVQSEAPRADLQLRLDPLTLEAARRLAPVAAALPPELAAEGDVSVSLDVSGTLTELRFEARVDARDSALRYAESFHKATGRPLELTLAGERRGDTISLATASFTVDRTTLRGEATLENLESPRIEFAVRSDSLELASFGAAEPGAPDALRDLQITGEASLPDAGPKVSAALRSPAGSAGGVDYRDLALDLRLANQRVEISRLSVSAFDGTLTATGSYDLKGTQPRFDLKTQADGIRVEKALASQIPGSGDRLTGGLGASLELRGVGSTWEQIKPTLTGRGSVAIRDGVLREFNPAGETMQALLALSAFSGSGLAKFVERHPKVFGIGETPFEELASAIDVRDGWVQLKGLELDVRDYVVSGGGRYSLDNELDFRTQLGLSQALSEEILQAEPRMRYLRTADGRVEVPVAFRGAPPKIAAVPDVSRLAQGAAREAATELLGRALGGGRATQPAPQDDAPAPSEEEAATPPSGEEVGDELLRRGLEGLLGGGRDQ